MLTDKQVWTFLNKYDQFIKAGQERFEILDIEEILVYDDCTLKDVLKWRNIDHHFRDREPENNKEAPSPIAQFPASERGWTLAKAFALL